MAEDYQGLTPPLELLWQWEDDILTERDNVDHVLDCAWRDGFRTGADQELDACCEWVSAISGKYGPRLRLARRPKPPSLTEQALAALDQADKGLSESEWQQRSDTIRRALEHLQELENNG